MMRKAWEKISSFLWKSRVVYLPSDGTFTAVQKPSLLAEVVSRWFGMLLFALWSFFAVQFGRVCGKMEATLEPILTKYYARGVDDGFIQGYYSGLEANVEAWIKGGY